MSIALLLVDIQNDYFPGGKMELHGALEAAQTAGQLLYGFREKALPVVHIQHLSTRPGATFFLPETVGAQIHDLVRPIPGETVMIKHFPNSFRDTGLLAYLREHSISRLVVSGMMTHMCIDATVRAACDYGFDCRTVQDGCATRDLTFNGHRVAAAAVQAAFLASLDKTFGRVVTAAELVQELQEQHAN
jgi:nicotinamidase-related amidase